MIQEVAPGIFRLPIPLPDSPLGTINVYALTGKRLRLVDCGWNTPQAYTALLDQLAELGARIQDIGEILVTHIHPDHFGLAGRLAEESGAPVMLHRMEAIYVGARYEHTSELVQEMDSWLRVHGVPPVELDAMTAGSLEMLRRVGTRPPDVLLEGGEVLRWDPYHFEVLWTPGHSSGLICLYDRESQLLLASDHVLQRISPHVGLHAQSLGNPLDDYLSSLRQIRDLPVRLVLPGHGAPFTNLAKRIDELLQHHEDRLKTILEVLKGGEQTAFSVTGSLSWRGAEDGWLRLAPFQRRMALTETIAHLEHLYAGGKVTKRIKGSHALYRNL